MENRERDIQYTEEPGLPLGTQLWSRAKESIHGIRNADDIGVPCRSSAANMLSVVRQGDGEVQHASSLLAPHSMLLRILPTQHLGGPLRSDH